MDNGAEHRVSKLLMADRLTIRAEQLRSFEYTRRLAFEDKVFRHLTAFFPDECAKRVEKALREMVHQAIDRGFGHGFETERDLCKYASVAFVLGLDFEKNPLYPWAPRILEGPGSTTFGRADRLLDAAVKASDYSVEPPPSLT